VAKWHTPDTAREQWANAPAGAALDELLEYARDECLRYEPIPASSYTPPVGEEGQEPEVPVRYRLAQLAAAQAAWEYRKGNAETGNLGLGDYATRPRTVLTAMRTYLRGRIEIG
jgi:hypothetical protein